MEVEDQVKFADIAEVLVKNLHKGMDEFKNNEFVLVFVHNCNEVQTSVSFVYDFILFVLEEITHFWFTGDHQLVYLT